MSDDVRKTMVDMMDEDKLVKTAVIKWELAIEHGDVSREKMDEIDRVLRDFLEHEREFGSEAARHETWRLINEECTRLEAERDNASVE